MCVCIVLFLILFRISNVHTDRPALPTGGHSSGTYRSATPACHCNVSRGRVLAPEGIRSQPVAPVPRKSPTWDQCNGCLHSTASADCRVVSCQDSGTGFSASRNIRLRRNAVILPAGLLPLLGSCHCCFRCSFRALVVHAATCARGLYFRGFR